jgi:hypothetical protein
MSTELPHTESDQEIDLMQVSHKINSFFKRINRQIFNGIQFFVRNWVIVLVLIVAGFGIGLFLDKTQKSYEHQIIVRPNFGSTDYLYTKVDLISSKIKEKDSVFFKNTLGISRFQNLNSIEIKPIADIYNFIKDKPENFELIKLMAEDGDIKKVLEENTTSKNYTFHTVTIVTKKQTTDAALLKPLLKYFNTSDYYSKIQKEAYQNVQFKMSQNDTIIKQIDGILSNFSNATNKVNKSDKLLYNNENTQLNDIIKSKDALLTEQGIHRIELLTLDKIIKDSSTTINRSYIRFINGYLKFVLPIVFVLLFVFSHIFLSFYKKQKYLNNVS